MCATPKSRTPDGSGVTQPAPHTPPDPSSQHPRAAFRRGKRKSAEEDVRWVADNLAVSDVEPKDAPSPAAYRMLQWALRVNSNEDKFWGALYTRLLAAPWGAGDGERSGKVARAKATSEATLIRKVKMAAAKARAAKGAA